MNCCYFFFIWVCNFICKPFTGKFCNKSNQWWIFLKTTYWHLLSCCQWVPVVSPKSWLEQLNFEVAPSRQYYEDFFRLWQADGSDIRTSENSLENPVLVVSAASSRVYRSFRWVFICQYLPGKFRKLFFCVLIVVKVHQCTLNSVCRLCM